MVRWRVAFIALLAWMSTFAAVTTGQNATEPQAMAWVTSRTGGALHFECSYDDITGFRILVNGVPVSVTSALVLYYDLYALVNNTAYTFQVKATFNANSTASSLESNILRESTASLSSPSVADPPILVNSSGGFIRAREQLPKDIGGANITMLAMLARSVVDFSVVSLSQPATQSEFVFYGLNARTEYYLSVYATNTGSLSGSESGFLSVKTLALRLAGPCPPLTVLGVTGVSRHAIQRYSVHDPSHVTVLFSVGASTTLELNPPLDDGGARIQGYMVYMASNGSSNYAEVASTAGTTPINILEILRMPDSTDLPLLPETRYDLKAIAIDNVDICLAMPSSLEPAAAVSAWTSVAAVPGAPPAPYFLSATGGQIVLELVPPVNMNGSILSGFSVMVNDIVYDFVAAEQSVTHSLSFLTASSSCAVKVAATTNLGTTTWSVPVTMTTTAPTAPSSPRNVTAVNTTASSATLQWLIPLDSGGADITGYDIVMTTAGYRAGREAVYTVKMAAINSLMKGSSRVGKQGISFETLAVTAPSEPWGLTSVASTGGSIEVSWNVPLQSGGTSLNDMLYNVTMFPIAPCYPVASEADPCARCDILKLQEGNEQYRRIIGASERCERPRTDSFCPRFQSLTALGGRFGVAWQPPEDTGGAPVLEYIITLYGQYRSVVLEEHRASGTEMSYTFAHLQANTLYYLTGKALTYVGESEAMEYAQNTGPPDLPGAPPPPTSSDIRGGSMAITVASPDYDGGDSVSLALYNKTSLIHRFEPGETNVTLFGLRALTTYSFTTTAINSRGETRGAPLLTTTSDITAPSGVQGLQQVDVTSDQLLLNWDPVQDTGGDVMLQYEVRYFKCDENGTQLAPSVLVTTPGTTFILLTHLDFSSYYSAVVNAITRSRLAGVSSETEIFATDEPYAGRIMVQLDEVVVQEDVSVVSVPVARVNGSFGNSSFTFTTQDDTAIAGVNYVFMEGMMTLMTNVKTGEILIPIIDDSVFQVSTSFLVIVTDEVTSLSTETRVVILDNGDAGYLSFRSPTFAFLENSGEVWLPITRTGGTSPPAVIEAAIVSQQSSLTTEDPTAQRFELIESTLQFDEGVTVMNLRVLIQDDSEFQLIRGSAEINFTIVEGGSRYRAYTSANFTAMDDGDISVPKACTNIRLLDASGGFMHLQWTPPPDRGGENVELSYRIDFAVNGALVLSLDVDTENEVVYGLTASTTYNVSVCAINARGSGVASKSSLLTTTKAVRATAPQYVDSFAAFTGPSDRRWWLSDRELQDLQCRSDDRCAHAVPSRIVRAATFLVSDGELSPPMEFDTSNPDVPDIPPMATITGVTAGAISVRMYNPINVGGSEVQWYRLFIKAVSDPEFGLIYEGVSPNFTVYRLQRKTTYAIKFQAQNIVGPSGYSPTQFATTEEKSLPSAPLDVVVTVVTGGAAKLVWNEPLDIAGRVIAGYSVMIRSSVTGVSDATGYDGKGITATEGWVYGLNANSTYTMYVLALSEVSNCFQRSDWVRSSNVTVRTLPPMAPGTAPLLILVRYTGGIIELQWIAPKDTGGVLLTGYVLYSVTPTGLRKPLFTSNASVLTYIDRDLTEATTYSYAVVASNAVGASPWSDVLVRTTSPASPPSVPPNVRQLAHNTGGAIEIGWERPIDTGGQPLKGYLVYRDGASLGHELPPTAVNYIDKNGLGAGKSYEYTLRAFSTSSLGSEFSAICTARTTVATKPQNRWLTRFTFTGLLASTVYTLAVVAQNDIGSSEVLLVPLTTQPGAIPAAPLALAVSVYGGNFTVELTVPVDTGGAVVTTMTLFETRLGIATTIKMTPGVPGRYTVYGAVSDTAYNVSCSATNVHGEGPRSPSLVIRTAPVNAPGIVWFAPRFVAATGISLTVAWSPPGDIGGVLSLAYQVRVMDLAKSTQAPFIYPSLTREVTATGLADSTAYAVSVRATNKAGGGPWSPAANMTTQPDAAGEFNFDNVSVSVLENATQVVLLISRINGLSGRVTVLYRVVPLAITNSATLGAGYALVLGSAKASATVVFEDMQIQASIVVYILNDNVYEPVDEEFALQLGSATASSSTAVAKIGANNTVRVTILDDVDAGYVGFDADEYAVSESAPFAVIPIIRESRSSGRVTLMLTLGPGTATIDRDYRKVPGQFVLEDGVTRAEFKVPIINDRVFEYPDEFFFIQMGVVSGDAILRRSIIKVVILDDGDTSVPGNCTPPVVLAKTGGAVTLSLGLPVHNGSAKGLLSGYILRLSSAIYTVELAKPPTDVVSLGNLTALTSYEVAVAAASAVGVGAFSDPMTFSTSDVSLPGPVLYIGLKARAGGRITLSWYAPDDTGGVPITKYRVYLIDAHGLPQVVVTNSDPIQEATVYGLNATTNYSFAVQAGNLAVAPEFAAGWGAPSAIFIHATGTPTLPGPTTIYPDLGREPTGGSIPLRCANLTNLPRRTCTNALFPFFLSRSSRNDPPLHGIALALYASTWYQFFVLPVNNFSAIDLPGNASVISSAKVAQTTADSTKLLPSGSVISIVDTGAYFVIGNMSKALKTVIPLFTNHVSGSLTNKKARFVGQSFSFVNLSTEAAQIPKAPLAPQLLKATGGLFELPLRSPDDTGGTPILDFKVFMDGVQLDSDSLSKQPILNGLLLSTTISVGDLKSRTNYTSQLMAVNALSRCYFGEVTLSPAITFTTTQVSPPGVPKVVAIRSTGAGVTLSLVDPKDKGGRTIERYQVYYMKVGDAANSWKLGYSGQVYQAEIARLTPLTAYYFKVSVFNGMFESVNSSNITQKTTAISAPGACAAPTLSSATGGMLNVSWQLPPDNGGSDVTSFFVAIANGADGSGQLSRFVSTRSHAFYGLQPETDYRVVVQAQNVKDLGPESNPTIFTTTVGTPPVGTIDVSIVRTSGGAASIAFAEPLDLGGTNPTDMIYQVFVDKEDTLNFTYAELKELTAKSSSPASQRRRLEKAPAASHRRLAAASSFTDVVVGRLDPEGLYTVQVQPFSGFGTGEITSGTPASTTTATAPSEPRNLVADVMTGGSITVTWEEPRDTGGASLDEDALYVASPSAAGPYDVKCRDTISTCTLYQLPPSTNYWFYVIATNRIGSSDKSTVMNALTKAISPPSTPTNVRITVVGHDSVDCTWDAPDDLGGGVILNYNVLVKSVDQTSSASAINANTAATVQTLAPSTAYSVVVTATNQVGDIGPPSLPLYFTTSASATSLPAPQVGCVSKTSISLLWYPFRSATAYHVVCNGTTIFSGQAAATGVITDSEGLIPGEYYEYKMLADFGSTVGAPSPPVIVATLDATFSAGETHCISSRSDIKELAYMPNSDMTWRIAPEIPFEGLTLTVAIHEDATNTLVWRGGCLREGSFVVQSTKALRVRFTSDASVSKRGFELHYEVNSPTQIRRIPAPGGNSNVCSQHGRQQNDGTCKCSIGFTGEDCSNRIVCCADTSRCHHSVCDLDPQHVIVVAGVLGDDALGTGRMMNSSEDSTASKAVRSLAKAISMSSDGDTIFLYPGVYDGAQNRDLAATSRNITIRTLKGSYWTSLDCDKAGRALDVSAASFLNIEGLALQNCAAAEGGAIRVKDAELIFDDVVISGASATQDGGGIHARNSKLTLSQSMISKCSASSNGGGLYLVESSLLLVNSNVSTSTATNGGAMAMDGRTTLTGLSSNFTGNTATADGGALIVLGDGVEVNGCAVSSNTANRGAGIAIQGANFCLQYAEIRDNVASSFGGGLSFVGNVNALALGTSVLNNHAEVSGGGVFVSGKGTLTLGSTGPTASGAGMHVSDSTMTIVGGELRDGVADTVGGGLAISSSQVKVSGMSITSNRAPEGAGLSIESSRVACIGDLTIHKNTALQNGGRVHIIGSAFAGNNLTLVEENTANEKGGGLHAQGYAEVTDVGVVSNTARLGGGAFFLEADVILQHVDFDKCTAFESGGGIFLSASTLTATETRVRTGSAVNGGGICAIDSTLSGRDVVIDSSSATGYGGGMFVTDKVQLSDVKIFTCDAKYGGGLAASNSQLEATASLLTSSTATLKGGGVYAKDSTIILRDTLLETHSCGDSGGGMYLERSQAQHMNLTVRDSQASRYGGGMYLMNSDLVAVPGFTSSYAQIVANSASTGGGNLFSTGASTLEQLEILKGNATSGGGLMLTSATGTIFNCSVADNVAANSGGGVHVSAASSAFLDSVFIMTNEAENSAGGGLTIDNSVVTHQDLTILENTAPNGGGIYAVGAVTLQEKLGSTNPCVVMENYMTTSKGEGCAMFIARGATVEVSSCDFSHGRAFNGGGISVDGAILKMVNSSVHDNKADSNGGGISLDANSELELINCEMYNNIAYMLGAGVASSGASSGALNRVTLQDCVFNFNRAVYDGGGITLSRTNLDGTGNVFSRNLVRLGAGGGVAALTEGSVKIVNWEFVDNTVGAGDAARGASLSFDGGANAVIKDSTIRSNADATLVPAGGLIYAKNPVTKLQIINSTLSLGQSFSGGLIYSVDATILIQYCDLLTGWANKFGGGIFAQNSLIDIQDSTMAENFAYYDGGAIYMRTGRTLTLRRAQFLRNVCQDRGGAFFIAPGAVVTCDIKDTEFTKNRNFGFGSSIFIGRKNSLVATNCSFLGNGDAANEGGALYAIDTVVSIEDSLFDSNYGYKGAAIELSRDAQLTVKNTLIRNNTAEVWGGALYTSVRSSATMISTTFERNQATEGGVLYSVGSSRVTFTKVNVRDNTALNFGGVASLKGSSTFVVNQVTFTSNDGHTGGAISVAENASLSLQNSELKRNTARDFGGAIYIDTETRTEDNAIISLLAKSGVNRIIAGLIIFLIYLSVMLFYQPYKERSDSALAGVTQIQLSITLFCGLILKMGSLYLEPGVVSLLTYVTLLTNIATLAYAILSIIYEKIDAARKLRRRIRDEHRKAIQQHVVKLWRKAYGFAFTEVYLRDTTIRPMPVHVILELARRDKRERELEALRVQLELTSTIIRALPNDVSPDQVDVELPTSAATQ
ncbi:hypothetical protein FI667_g12333, partial [Globisporangium splendens]